MSKQPSDFNDLGKNGGLSLVKKQVVAAIDAEKGIPYGQFTIKPNGVYWTKSEDADPIYFCSYIKPVGLASTVRGEDYSLVMEMRDPKKIIRKFVLSPEALHVAGGEKARLEFARRGGYFGQGIRTRQAFSDFYNAIMSKATNLPGITLVHQTGWLRLKNSTLFVLPDAVVGGTNKEQVILQNPETGGPEYVVRGTLAEWQDKVSRFCVSNSRLLQAVSVPFAGALLEMLNKESGGIHFMGISSLGKSTLLGVSASVSGEPRSIVKTMNATASAFEVQASLANDSTLLLDELGEAPPEQLGGVIYKLANGVGRGRADQSGNARERRNWRLLFMTTGETDLESMMKAAGKRTYAGQTLRHANIPADTGKHGVFEELHGHLSGAALSEYLRQETMNCYGAPLRKYLEKLVEERNRQPVQLQERLHALIEQFKTGAVPQGADGQVSRVAGRFALVAAGGELATEYGVTGWPVGASFDGVMVCFKAWLERRGTNGKAETETLIQQVESFFELHGESRFAPMETEGVRGPAKVVINRAGFRKIVCSVPSGDTDTEYYVFPSAFREMVTGHDAKWAAKILSEKGYLKPGRDRSSVSVNLPGMSKTRCYVFPARINEEPGVEAEVARNEGYPF
jgi:putative DNA primase/helicase